MLAADKFLQVYFSFYFHLQRRFFCVNTHFLRRKGNLFSFKYHNDAYFLLFFDCKITKKRESPNLFS